MRRPPFRGATRLRLFALFAALVCASPKLGAQGASGTEGALFLVLASGARAVGVGEAVVAHRGTPREALWWNPAGIAGATQRDVSLQHSQQFLGTRDGIVLLIPSQILGVLGVSLDILDYGELEFRDPQNVLIGTGTVRNVGIGATYGTMITSRASTGLSVKLVQFEVDCSGLCPSLSVTTARTVAVDIGAQYEPVRTWPLTFGVALRNLGPPLQVNDSPQSDPLPRRLQFGAEYRFVPKSPQLADAEMRFSLDILDDLTFKTLRPRVGAELVWQRRAFVRAGYVTSAGGSESGGPSIGLGYSVRAITVDIARVLTGFSADAGQAPTYLAIRVRF